jgi:hypothetical protein
MELLKNLFIVLVVIAIIGAIVVYFLPTSYTVSNSIVVNRPASEIYAQIYDFNKWANWSPWMEADPEAKVSIEGTAGTPGHKMSWVGKKSGTGSMTLAASSVNQFVNCDLAFIKPGKTTGKVKFQLEANGDKTTVTWTNSGGLAFPAGRVFGLFVGKMLGNDQVKGLDKLKKLVESLPTPAPAVVDTTVIAKQM